MNEIKVFNLLQDQGFSKDNAEALVRELKTSLVQEDLKELATKQDILLIRTQLSDLQITFHKELHSLTIKFVGFIALIGTVMKLIDLFVKR